MPMTFTAEETRSGVRYQRVVASGPVTVEEVLSLDEVIARGPLLGIVEPSADFLADVQRISKLGKKGGHRAAIVVTTAPLRAMLAFAGRIADLSTTRFFSIEEYALAWLDESPSQLEAA